MAQFTQKHAELIARKLDCLIREGKRHTRAALFHNGVLLPSFGIRRGSKQTGHDYLPRELHLKQNECWELYDCGLTREAYLQLMRARGKLR